MDHQDNHLNTQPDPGCGSVGRYALRVPFGLRDGRVWAPREVEPGLACGCVCPACLQPLIAKAIASSKRVPHFAHHGNVACQTGAETGIHLRAKQVIADRMRIHLPAWGGSLLDMPNPPVASDTLRHLYEGERVEFPGGNTPLLEVQKEYTMDGFTPDVFALDAEGVLLIEIRYTHAVDEPKAARVRDAGFRMVEIDLSTMDRDTPHDPDAFERLVLDEPGNRSWISCPTAERAWAASKSALDRRIEEINRQIEEAARKEAAEAEARLAKLKSEYADKVGRKAYMRQKLRNPHLQSLAALPGLMAPERIARVTAELDAAAAEKIEELRRGLPPALDHACMTTDRDEWIYGVAGSLWRLCVLRHFVLRNSPGFRFNNRDVFQWVKRSLPIDKVLYDLFMAQYTARREAREAGRHKKRISLWAFTEEENALIPNFFQPVNRFTDRLVYLRSLRPVEGELGGLEIAAILAHGMIPAAVVDDARPDSRR